MAKAKGKKEAKEKAPGMAMHERRLGCETNKIKRFLLLHVFFLFDSASGQSATFWVVDKDIKPGFLYGVSRFKFPVTDIK